MLKPHAPPFNYSRPCPPPTYYFQVSPPPPPPFQEWTPTYYPPFPHCFQGSPPPPPPMIPNFSTTQYNLSPYYTTYFVYPFLPSPLRLPPSNTTNSASSSVKLSRSSTNITNSSMSSSKDVMGSYTSSPITTTTTLSSSPPSDTDDSQPENGSRTTVMIRNIPNKISRAMLLQLLDEQCVKQNQKASSIQGSPLSEYDFVYLPMDFRNRCNLGYAFVNFTTAMAARRLFESLGGHKWDFMGSGKVTHVCYARIQGKVALMNRFKSSLFRCHSEEFLPALLSPPRDGATSRPDPSVVGRRVGLHPR